MGNKQNEISHIYLQGSDLADREQEVLADACQKTGFKTDEIVSRSSWWGSKEIGAFSVSGNYKRQNAVLKIQGVKPTVSEVYMIRSFTKANQSKLIRPPKLYAFWPWDNEKRYEALILESVQQRVVQTPTTPEELELFFAVYADYRQNCVSKPWLDKPTDTIAQRIADNFAKWREASFKLYPTHLFRKEEDKGLIDKAVAILRKGYAKVDFQFEHGHFSEGDLYQQGNQIVLLSNLYWGWKPPLYDAVFGQHWFIYRLAEVADITPEKIEEQRKLWSERIEALQRIKQNPTLYKLALLERAAAGLNLDALSVGTEKPIAEYLVEETREQVKNLIMALEK